MNLQGTLQTAGGSACDHDSNGCKWEVCGRSVCICLSYDDHRPERSEEHIVGHLTKNFEETHKFRIKIRYIL